MRRLVASHPDFARIDALCRSLANFKSGLLCLSPDAPNYVGIVEAIDEDEATLAALLGPGHVFASYLMERDDD